MFTVVAAASDGSMRVAVHNAGCKALNASVLAGANLAVYFNATNAKSTSTSYPLSSLLPAQLAPDAAAVLCDFRTSIGTTPPCDAVVGGLPWATRGCALAIVAQGAALDAVRISLVSSSATRTPCVGWTTQAGGCIPVLSSALCVQQSCAGALALPPTDWVASKAAPAVAACGPPRAGCAAGVAVAKLPAC
jgi:hypothetical protein